MPRTEAELIRDAARTGRQDADNVADGREILHDFFDGDPVLVLHKTDAEVAERIAYNLKLSSGLDDFAAGMADAMDDDESLSAAGMRKAFDAWAEAWAKTATPDVQRAARLVQDEQENPRPRKRARRR